MTTWSQVIATYNRFDMLKRSLELNAQQTRPPKQIIVVDSSADWQDSQSYVLENIAPNYPDIEWIYIEAEHRSSALQRNQGMQYVTSDVLFMFDDDSLPFADCAENVMAVYDADTENAVAGVNASHVPEKPGDLKDVDFEIVEEYATTKKYSGFVKGLRKLLKADDVFVDYDPIPPNNRVPENLKHLSLFPRKVLVGWGMTFRTELAKKEPFEGILKNYAAGEDSDMSYRVSRHGKLLTATNARLHHVGSVGGRMPLFVVAALGALNPLVLHRLHSTDLSRSKTLSFKLLMRRCLIMLSKDLSKRRLSLPSARGYLYAIFYFRKIFSMGKEELRAWYPGFQAELIATKKR